MIQDHVQSQPRGTASSFSQPLVILLHVDEKEMRDVQLDHELT